MFLRNPTHIPVVCNGWGGVNMLGIRFHVVWGRPWITIIIKPLEPHNNNEGTVRLNHSKWYASLIAEWMDPPKVMCLTSCAGLRIRDVRMEE